MNLSNQSGAASLSRCSRRPLPIASSQLPCCVGTSVRFTPLQIKVFFLDNWKTNSQTGLVYRTKKKTHAWRCPPFRRARRLTSKPTSEFSCWQPRRVRRAAGLSALAVAPCVWGGLRCVRVNPRLRFSPLLSATTRMYHHVTVGCPQRDCTPSTPRFDPPIP